MTPLLLAALLAGAAPKPAAPTLDIRVYPKVGFTPAYVRVSAIARDPDHQLNCPDWHYDFGDGSSSAGEEWCDPYQQDDRPDRYAFPMRQHVYRLSGEFTVTVTVRGGTEHPLRQVATVVISGREGLPGARSDRRGASYGDRSAGLWLLVEPCLEERRHALGEGSNRGRLVHRRFAQQLRQLLPVRREHLGHVPNRQRSPQGTWSLSGAV